MIKWILNGLILFVSCLIIPLNSLQYELVVCAVFQNEELFLKEWIEYHKLMGVEHFYLYDNLSTDRSLDILQPYILRGDVELFEWDVETHSEKEYLQLLQVPTYTHALKLAQQSSRWAAFIDIDEFISLPNCDNLQTFLKEYQKFAALSINWQIFGTSNIDHLQEGELITEKLVWKAPTTFSKNEYIKYIVQPQRVLEILDPHHFVFNSNDYAVNSNKEPLRTLRGQPFIHDKISIHHYWFGTKHWFLNNKLPRRAKWGMAFPNYAIQSLIDSCNVVLDTTLARFSQQLKMKMEETQ